MKLDAKWICPGEKTGDGAPAYRRIFTVSDVKSAALRITSLGVYEARINGRRVGEFFMAPGFTSYRYRIQVQEYDVSDLLRDGENELTVTVAKGWYHSPFLAIWEVPDWRREMMDSPLAMIAELRVGHTDGSSEVIGTGEGWEWSQSPISLCSIYDGEVYDATFAPLYRPVSIYDGPDSALIPQEGPEVRPHETFTPVVIRTPAGETVLDFGQNMAGIVRIRVSATAGQAVDLSFGEVLDGGGNFYNANYRGAKSFYRYTCTDGEQEWEPRHTFYGFRYVRVNEFPGGCGAARPENFTAVVMHSDMRRTGRLSCSDPLLDRFFENAIWSQKSNFLDIPTDCPQRDERAGWTGDAQMFAKTACLNFDTEKFFAKWLADLRADQKPDGNVSAIVPDVRDRSFASPAWGDAATIIPWQVYLAYGNKKILEDSFDSMRRWVGYITSVTTVPGLWRDIIPEGKRHYGDWLALDAPYGSYKGSSRDDYIGTAYYAYSTQLVIRAGRVLGRDVSEYERLYRQIVDAFRAEFPEPLTQTECVLAAHFGLAADPQAAADILAKMVVDAGCSLTTGFIGTPYLLHVLSDYGYGQLAWSLLLRREYPSWLYSVSQGATTVWEHWDGIRPDGRMWSTDMNSFNHYAYGSVTDWVYTKAAGIRALEEAPGYENVLIAPLPDARLDWLSAGLMTRHGQIGSKWSKSGDGWKYEIETAVPARIVIGGESREVAPGRYTIETEGR